MYVWKFLYIFQLSVDDLKYLLLAGAQDAFIFSWLLTAYYMLWKAFSPFCIAE